MIAMKLPATLPTALTHPALERVPIPFDPLPPHPPDPPHPHPQNATPPQTVSHFLFDRYLPNNSGSIWVAHALRLVSFFALQLPM